MDKTAIIYLNKHEENKNFSNAIKYLQNEILIQQPYSGIEVTGKYDDITAFYVGQLLLKKAPEIYETMDFSTGAVNMIPLSGYKNIGVENKDIYARIQRVERLTLDDWTKLGLLPYYFADNNNLIWQKLSLPKLNIEKKPFSEIIAVDLPEKIVVYPGSYLKIGKIKFNGKLEKIGSYYSNYKTRDKVFRMCYNITRNQGK